MKGNLHVIGCGGAGTNIAVDVFKRLRELEDTLSNVDVKFLDTTDKTIQKYPEFKEHFTKITSERFTVQDIDGMSGERKNPEVVSDIQENIKKWMDVNRPSNNVNDYYIIISSASGGSGSIINPLLTRALLSRDYTVLNFVVGDSSNLLNLENTINTIVSLNSIAKATKSVLPLMFFDNAVNGNTTPATEKINNDKIFKMLTLISLYTSGSNRDLDHEDMRKFFNPHRYKTFTVTPGLYTLGVAEKELTDEHALLARTLIREGQEDIKIKVNLLHNKVGVISKENEDMLPAYPNFLILRNHIISRIVNELKEEHEKLKSLKRVKHDDILGIDDGMEDDSGLVL